MRRPRAFVLAVATSAWLVAGATAVMADPAGPTNFRTVVTDVGVVTDDDGSPVTVDVEVIGGDSYLRLDALGQDVLLRGYDGEELYLRWLSDGRVQVNRNSVAAYQNDARFGLGENQIPATAGPEVPPSWETVSTDGTYAWHDHRIHWMTPTSLPPNVDASLDEPQLAYVWPEPIVLEVESRDVTIEGELRWFPDASPVVAILAFLAAVVAAVFLSRGTPDRATTVLVSVGAVVTGVVGAMENVGLAAGVQGRPLALLLPGIALFATGAAVAARARGEAARLLGAAAGIPLVVWAIVHAGAVTAPVLPVEPAWLLRVAVGLAAGSGVAAVVLAGVRLFATPLVPDQDVSPVSP